MTLREIVDTRARRDVALERLEELSELEELQEPFSESDVWLAQNEMVAEIEDSLPWWARWRT